MSFKILTYNTMMLPGIAGGGAQDDKRRAGRIVDAILANGYDVVCLQEVFDEDVRFIFSTRLRLEYDWIVEKSDDNDFLQEDSGLFFASRHPMRSSKFIEFTDSEPFTSDALADKGVFGALLDVSAGADARSVFVFNTHMQSTQAHSGTRAKQFAQIQRFVRRALETMDSPELCSAVLCGDLNVIGDTDAEYHRMLSLLGAPRDVFREANPGHPGHTWDGGANSITRMRDPGDFDRQRLDYLLTFNSVPVADDNAQVSALAPLVVKSVEVKDFKAQGRDLSDHYGLESVFGFSDIA